MMQQQDQRSILNEIFLPLAETSWELFPRSILSDWGLHQNTLLFFSEKYDSLALLITRREPSDDTFVGNFPCSLNVLEWMRKAIRPEGNQREEGVKYAFVATIENARVNEVISFALVSEVEFRARLVDPFISKKTGEKFFWLDQDLFPARIYSKRRPFREVTRVAKFMRRTVQEAAD